MEYEGVELATFNNTTYALLSFDSEKALTGGPGVESLGWISLKQVAFKIAETPYSAGTKSALGKLCQQFNHHLFALVQLDRFTFRGRHVKDPQTLRGSFSAASRQIFASKHFFAAFSDIYKFCTHLHHSQLKMA